MVRAAGLMLLVLLAVAACGKRGDPEPANPERATWPRPPVAR